MIWLKIRIQLNKLNTLLQQHTTFKSPRCSINESSRANLCTRSTKLTNKEKLEFKRNAFVYEIKDNSHLIITSVLGFTGFVFSMYFSIAVQNLQTIDKVVAKDEFVEDSKSRWFIYSVSKLVSDHQKAVAIGALTFGCIITGLCQLYCISSIRSITLFKGGEHVIINLFRSNPFSTNYKALKVPLNDVCFHGTRADKGSTIQISIYKHRGFYILHKNGRFDKFLFDKVVGLHRDIRNRSRK